MSRSAILSLFVVVSLVLLVACEQYLVRSAKNQAVQNYVPSGRLTWCNQALQNANQELTIAKLQGKKQGLHGNWKFADDVLAQALMAKQHKDYNLCVAKSHVVINYIQRDQSYQQWKNSLSP